MSRLLPNRLLKGAALVLILGCDDGSGPRPAPDTTAHLVFRVQPSATRSGVAFSPPVVVSINDANNRLLPVDTLVTVRLREWPRASYGGTVSVRSIQGVATFDGLHIDGAGSGYTLSAQSDVAVDSAISDTFSVRFTPAITYNSRRNLNSNWEVFGATADGSVKVNLSHDSALDISDRWSPDGARLLVESDRTGDVDLYTLDSNSVVLTNLTRHTGNDYNGTWFPNGQRIAFLSDRDGDGGREIYIMNADGSAQARLTYDSATISGPIISPDGTQILYGTWRASTYNVYVMGADGSNRITLTTDTAPSLAFSWSPRGDQIAFSAGGHLILARPDGSNRKEILGDTLVDTSGIHACCAVFSPDGNRLAFLWNRSKQPPYYSTLEVSNIDGSGRLSLFTGSLGLYEWSSDGAWLLYSTGLESFRQIGIVKPDGTGGWLTTGPSDGGAHFRP